MSENTDQQAQKPEDTPEYLKFIGLLVVLLVVVLGVAALSPRLIGEVTPAVLGIGGAPAASPAQAVDEEPAAESAPAVEPESVVEPESAAAPEQAAPGEGQAGMGGQMEGLQHEVLPGQTLFQIAEQYGVSVQEIAAANNLVNPMQLQAGSILIIPQPQ